jgi:hypothetical protein
VTVVDVSGAERVRKPSGAEAFKAAIVVYTDTPILTRRQQLTFVDVLPTKSPHVARGTHTGDIVDHVNAHPLIHTRIRAALIQMHLTELPRVTRNTHAGSSVSFSNFT